MDGDNELRRAYSVCTPPSQEGTLSVGIKKVSDGTFSVYANEKLREGDVLEVLPPEGRFVFTPSYKARTIMAIAAGSGITPIMSIIRTALESHAENQVVLLYGNQGPTETMWKQDSKVDCISNTVLAGNPRMVHYLVESMLRRSIIL